MFEVPSLYGSFSHLTGVSQQEIEEAKQLCSPRSVIPCDNDMFDLCCQKMNENDLLYPKSCDECVDLYFTLRDIIRTWLNA